MKIAVAMSGGVDSSVAAALLKEQGHDIFGVTMRQYDLLAGGYKNNEGIQADINDAKLVCENLSIKHYTIDVQSEFSEIVVSNFISEYKNGKTPNPCTLCNPTIKFGVFLKEALKLGAEKMATGHYLKILEKKGVYSILQATDIKKDQSYMLWGLNQKQLAKCVFPIADFSKTEVREIARKFGLPVHQKKESQEICFIKGHYDTFLRDKISFSSGEIILQDGEVIGKHRGLPFYTIGQRKGLNTNRNSSLFVLEVDVKNNRLIVTEDIDDLYRDSVFIHDVNWISGNSPQNTSNLLVQIRYNSKPVPVKEIIRNSKGYEIKLLGKTRAVTPGQSAVLYKDDILLGGGMIS